MKTITTLCLLVLSTQVFADQCAFVTIDSANTAVKLISLSKKNTGGILKLCQNCGEREPRQIKVNQIDTASTGSVEVPVQVEVNGERIDLAYTYVKISAETWGNLGKLSNCPVEGASPFIIEKKGDDGIVRFVPSAKY